MMEDPPPIVRLEVPAHELPLVRPTAHPPRTRHMVPLEGPDGRGSRPRPLEGVTQEANGVLDLPVGIEDDAGILRRAEAHRSGKLESRPAGVAQDTARPASAQARAFGLTPGPLASREEAIGERGRVVQAIFLKHEGPGEGAEFPSPMPGAGAPRPAGDLQAQDQTDLAQADLGDEALKARPVGRRGA